VHSLFICDFALRRIVAIGEVTNRPLLLEHGDIRALGVVGSKLAFDGAKRLDLSRDVEQVDLRNVFLYVLKPSLHHLLSWIFTSLRLRLLARACCSGRASLRLDFTELKLRVMLVSLW